MAGNNSIWEVSNVNKSLSVREDRAAAVSLMEHQANKQIAALQKQADLLVQQVDEIRTRVELAYLVSTAEYGFTPVILKEYYLYKNLDTDVLTLSLVSPKEWGGNCPYGECVAPVRKLSDSTWEKVEIAESSQSEQSSA